MRTTLNEDRFVQILHTQGGVLHALSAGGDVYRFVSTRWDEEMKKTVPGFWKRLPNVRKDEEIVEGRPKWLKKRQADSAIDN